MGNTIGFGLFHQLIHSALAYYIISNFIEMINHDSAFPPISSKWNHFNIFICQFILQARVDIISLQKGDAIIGSQLRRLLKLT